MTTHGQVYIEKLDIYLYQHTDAYNIPISVHTALKEYFKWCKTTDHPETLAGIIVKEMLKETEHVIEIWRTRSTDIEWLVTITKDDIVQIETGYIDFKIILKEPILDFINNEIPTKEYFINWGE
jgi:hypothetical protein